MTYKILAFIPPHSMWETIRFSSPYHLPYSAPRSEVVLIQPVHSRNLKSPLQSEGVRPWTLSFLQKHQVPLYCGLGTQPFLPKTDSSCTGSTNSMFPHLWTLPISLLPWTPCWKAWDSWDTCKLLSQSISRCIQILTPSVMLSRYVPTFLLNPME